MKQLDTDRCKYSEFILHRRTYIHIVFFVKASSGHRYIDSYRPTLPVAKPNSSRDQALGSRLTPVFRST